MSKHISDVNTTKGSFSEPGSTSVGLPKTDTYFRFSVYKQASMLSSSGHFSS